MLHLRILKKSILTIILFLLLHSNTYSQRYDDICFDEQERLYGMVTFSVDPNIIFFRAGVSAIIFDTSFHKYDQRSVPEYRLIDNLIVDSIIVGGTAIPVIKKSHLDSIFINSSELINTFKSLNVYKLFKVFSKAVPYDTLFWDSDAKTYKKLNDLSRFYNIAYHDSLEIDSVIRKLRAIPNVEDVEAVYKITSEEQ